MVYHIYYSNFVLPNIFINKTYSNKLHKCIFPNLYVSVICNYLMHKLSNWDFEKWKFWSKFKFLESEIYETEIFENENFLKEILKLKFWNWNVEIKVLK